METNVQISVGVEVIKSVLNKTNVNINTNSTQTETYPPTHIES